MIPAGKHIIQGDHFISLTRADITFISMIYIKKADNNVLDFFHIGLKVGK